ncbi:MAG: Ltp family lipoprotein [Clostridiales bacterium]|nr:Ltp family lipoprotein [Clostridiales bacterium]
MKKLLAILLSLTVILSMVGCGSSTSTDSGDTSVSAGDESDSESSESADAEPEDSSDEEDTADEDDAAEETVQETDVTESMTTAQKNAYQSAKSYLSFSGFSRQGLIDQLTSEYGDGYEVDDATFAIETLEANNEVDWNEEAYESAKSYLSFSTFSRQRLIDQLTSEYGEQFEADEAEYAVSTLESNGEVDWNEQAYESAKSYLEYSSFSLDGLIEQLESEYGEQFTHEQAEYGAEKAYEE